MFVGNNTGKTTLHANNNIKIGLKIIHFLIRYSTRTLKAFLLVSHAWEHLGVEHSNTSAVFETENVRFIRAINET